MYGEKNKRELLEKEGIKIENGFVKNFQESRFVFEQINPITTESGNNDKIIKS